MAVMAWACNVPVFRYALERWPPDPYHLAVFYAGGEEGERPVLAALDALKDRPINLVAEAVDVDQLDADDWRLTDVELDRGQLPWSVLRYPPRSNQAPPIAWSGRFDAEVLPLLTNSSVRQEVVRRLLTGESAVWVLVESGDREKDEAARKCLERELAEAPHKLRIPGMEELDYTPTDPETPQAQAPSPEVLAFGADPAIALPLKVHFSLLSLSRDHAAELGLLAMLLHSEPDLHEYAGEPIVFPIFGQGRALWALVGKGINAENIFESCAFLTGPCSCQVKQMNPGMDLLLDFDWAGALEGRVPPPPEITPDMLTAVAPLLDDDDQAEQSPQLTAAVPSGIDTHADAPVVKQVPDDVPSPISDSPSGGPPVFVVTGAVLGGLLLIVAAATVVLLGKRNQ
jgi:hypothetical protein